MKTLISAFYILTFGGFIIFSITLYFILLPTALMIGSIKRRRLHKFNERVKKTTKKVLIKDSMTEEKIANS